MKKLLLVLILSLVASNVFAQTKPFQASLTPGIAVHSRDTRIEGLSVSVWGENPQSGGAIGVINGSRGNSSGISFGFVNYAQNYTGVEWGAVNYAKGNFIGLQYGFVNYAKKLKGLQLGFLNFAETAESGLQIGLINVIEKNEWFKRMPDEFSKGMVLVNWRF
ncbi:MAG: hypothetical protein JXL81_08625 [Deltaproteobacteria bacterium]|nr:hypothetical protein [Deltaproteobacteria bacterium]